MGRRPHAPGLSRGFRVIVGLAAVGISLGCTTTTEGAQRPLRHVSIRDVSQSSMRPERLDNRAEYVPQANVNLWAQQPSPQQPSPQQPSSQQASPQPGTATQSAPSGAQDPASQQS